MHTEAFSLVLTDQGGSSTDYLARNRDARSATTPVGKYTPAAATDTADKQALLKKLQTAMKVGT
jgi:hypothetical protein